MAMDARSSEPAAWRERVGIEPTEVQKDPSWF